MCPWQFWRVLHEISISKPQGAYHHRDGINRELFSFLCDITFYLHRELFSFHWDIHLRICDRHKWEYYIRVQLGGVFYVFIYSSSILVQWLSVKNIVSVSDINESTTSEYSSEGFSRSLSTPQASWFSDCQLEIYPLKVLYWRGLHKLQLNNR